MVAMKLTDGCSAVSHSTMPRLYLVLSLCAAMLLAASMTYASIDTPNFDPTYSRTVEKDEQMLFSSWTDLIDCTSMEGELVAYPLYEGVILLTDKRVLFAVRNNKTANL
jgi:hypothetical protein